MGNAHCSTWNMARKLKITKNEKYKLQGMKCPRKTEGGGKLKNVHCRTGNMARKLKIMENEEIPLDLKNEDITEKHEKKKCTLQDLEYGKKTENHGK